MIGLRLKRLKTKKRKRRLQFLSLLISCSIILVCFTFWQEVYSKENAVETVLSEKKIEENLPNPATKKETVSITKQNTNQKTDSHSNQSEKKNTERKKETKSENAQANIGNTKQSKQENSQSKDQKKSDQKQKNDTNNDKNNGGNENVGEKENAKQNNKPGKEKIVYLTFDDGPESYTTDILQLLAKYDAKATFFMLEPKMREYPHIVKEIIKQGHQVGLHSVTHDKEKFYANEKTVVGEMMQSQSTLKKIANKSTNLIRTPYGSKPHMKSNYLTAVNNAGFIMWDWNIDSRDWSLIDGMFVENVIYQMNHFNKNEPMIILLHDRQTTLNHLERLLIYLKEHHYQMEIITEKMTPVQFK